MERITDWDEFFMRKVYLAAMKSKDIHTKIGAVLVKDKNSIVDGYNGFPRGVIDSDERYENKELKYSFVCHAEANTINTAARLGISTAGTTLFSQGIPCHECCKALIQGGVKEIVIHRQWPHLQHRTKWVESVKISNIMFNEAGVEIRTLNKVLGVKGWLDGMEIDV